MEHFYLTFTFISAEGQLDVLDVLDTTSVARGAGGGGDSGQESSVPCKQDRSCLVVVT